MLFALGYRCALCVGLLGGEHRRDSRRHGDVELRVRLPSFEAQGLTRVATLFGLLGGRARRLKVLSQPGGRDRKPEISPGACGPA